MLIKIVAVGRLKDRALQARCDEFAKWLGPYAKLEIRELPDSTVEREGKARVPLAAPLLSTPQDWSGPSSLMTTVFIHPLL